MRTTFSEQIGIEYPIFAFSHCRDVVAAVSKAGGLGVMGAARLSPEELELDLKWLDSELSGLPYGVDVLIPNWLSPEPSGGMQTDTERVADGLPETHQQFVESLTERFELPELPPDSEAPHAVAWSYAYEVAQGHVDVAFRHDIALIANGLGTPPQHLVQEAHERDVLVGALAGKVSHAHSHVRAGVDVVIAQSYEAGGHTGDIGGVVLWPEVIRAIEPVPVLAAGGIATGRQIAAALALGAAGAWMGSVWLPTVEGDDPPGVKARYLAASSTDTVRSREHSGKPARKLSSPWVEAWSELDAPGPLAPPLQGRLVAEAEERIKRAGRDDLRDAPVGQVVGLLDSSRHVQDVIFDMVSEYIQVAEWFAGQLD